MWEFTSSTAKISSQQPSHRPFSLATPRAASWPGRRRTRAPPPGRCCAPRPGACCQAQRPGRAAGRRAASPARPVNRGVGETAIQGPSVEYQASSCKRAQASNGAAAEAGSETPNPPVAHRQTRGLRRAIIQQQPCEGGHVQQPGVAQRLAVSADAAVQQQLALAVLLQQRAPAGGRCSTRCLLLRAAHRASALHLDQVQVTKGDVLATLACCHAAKQHHEGAS